MNTWRHVLRDATVSGSVASLTSTAALAVCGKADAGSPLAATNAVSHWYWGEPAKHRDGFSVRHTVLGFAIHHAASIFWAIWHEKFFGSRRATSTPLETIGHAAVTAGVAYFVDYYMTPRRLTPGFERRLSAPSMFAVYAAFAAGLVLGGVALSSRSASDPVGP